MNDELIIQMFRDRSEHAISELTDKYGALCRSISHHILSDEQDVSECLNDMCLAVWNTIPPSTPDSLQAYVCRITRNLSIKKYRYNTAGKRNPQYETVLDELEEVMADGPDVENLVLEKELTEKINFFLGQLKPRERILFIKRYWFHKGISEIAKETGRKSDDITVSLHRTRMKLKNYLNQEGYNIE